ncbi:MAG TPA: hypothetical protein DDW93_11960, partial [Firmicutes bacterium]|nr:hypothetical protein [Bacillota bacterium]
AAPKTRYPKTNWSSMGKIPARTSCAKILQRGNVTMKLRNKWIMKVITYGFLLINLLVSTSPAYAWTYNVQWGDSLFKLSERYGTQVNELKNANKLSSDRIFAGRKVWIPDSNPMPNTQLSSIHYNNDLYLLARLINGEARGEFFEGQVAVGAVILNRIKSGQFPPTIAGNIYQGRQFESVANGEIWQPLTTSSLKAAEAALSG